jgi:hypothetical protein
MFNSRNIDDLRPDVAVNCRIMLDLCKAAGLPVIITGTVRDAEYQEECFRRGTAKTKTPSFHAVGLAFDIAKNVPGHEFDDLSFFQKCAEIGKKIGFEWGGGWQSIKDNPHFQWSGMNRSFTSGMILQGYLPPQMPEYKEEKHVSDIKDVTVKVGSMEVPAKLIDGVTYVSLRPMVESIKNALAVTWTPEDGAGVELK